LSKRFLLDTCTALWYAYGSDELSETARESIQNGRNDVYISAVSAWEIAVKWSRDRLPLDGPPSEFFPCLVQGLRLRELPVEIEDALIAESLPWHHKDPFDRLLICQAQRRGLMIVTPDEAIRQYDVATLW
jgi:PIN domain nuclease of toxin-antitoxin system